MDILIVTSEQHVVEECKLLFANKHVLRIVADRKSVGEQVDLPNVIFDFTITFDDVYVYENFQGVVFLNCVYTTLSDILPQWRHHQCSYFGFNGLPTFIHRSILEISIVETTSESTLKRVCESIGIKYIIVPDQIGMVSLRVIFMIINEAYFTEEDGTATREDIDKAMRLGTNYPYGPFEWGNKIGEHHLVGVLQTLRKQTRDDRYVVCESLIMKAKKSSSQ